MKLSGIYIILNLLDGRMYIGSSVDVAYRWRKHREALRRGRHHSPFLQNAWNAHGESTFMFMMVKSVEQSQLLKVEQYYLDRCIYVYNGSRSASCSNPAGSKLPDQWRINAAAAWKEKFLTKVRSGEIPNPYKGRTNSESHRTETSIRTRIMWSKRRKELIAAQKAGIDPKQRSEAARKLWRDPEYAERNATARRGIATNKGYKCTPEQVKNRRKAARISNMKRNYGDSWRIEYARRYPQNAHEVAL